VGLVPLIDEDVEAKYLETLAVVKVLWLARLIKM